MAFPTKSSTASKIWELLTPADRRNAFVLLSLMFVDMILETLGVGLVIPAIALLAQSDIGAKYPTIRPVLGALGNPSQKALVIGGMLVLVGVYLLKAVFLAAFTWWQTRFAFNVQAQLSQRLFTVYLRQPYTFHLQRNSAHLIRNIINETSMFAASGILPGVTVLMESLVMLGLSVLLFMVEPVGAAIVVVVLGAAAYAFHHFTRKPIARWGVARQEHDGWRMQHLQQGLGGAKDVKLLGREAEFLDQFSVHNIGSARVAQYQNTMQQLPRLWLELLAVCGLAILVISMLAQHRALEAILPTLGLFGAAAFRFMPSVSRVLGGVQALQYGIPVIDILYDELKLPVPPPVERRQRPISHLPSLLELNNVTFTYPGAPKPAIEGVTLMVEPGESVGFIGASGAGKSTLVDVILGLLTPNGGEVLVGGKDIQLDLRAWQDQIGYVPQSIFLTDDTLRRNVAFGVPVGEIDDAAVARAIAAAQLQEFVASLTAGLETVVGERGVRLSGGQRQRIGIARALYHDPAVLVLDEATSALDTATEKGVMEAVTALQGKKTVLIVAHRLSTVERCGRLYRLRDGHAEETAVPNSGSTRQTGPISVSASV